MGQPGYDVLFKVRKFLDLIVPLFESEYNTQENVSIDEAMIPFKGPADYHCSTTGQYISYSPVSNGRCGNTILGGNT